MKFFNNELKPMGFKSLQKPKKWATLETKRGRGSVIQN
jgi:hypothetical protein